ncbi:GGDEF/EAL domain-containing protein [Butyrivibrio proteoclasticus B316]|uniref:GGDEF/EAL domain-containing protein n=1 Tax=Butyrivibrio proteoclasticus (strain ATCC 51982 / DSM 14932 / B316) TaxID=515622 RepID=E0S1J1_BUTPB|nr:GGDEF domain-containing protein [Butyrivibrio proteoclasticus]ADL33666.1 GGDEF/EAL domain-containing protein [Butyrivibrio proteoclasticus B316]
MGINGKTTAEFEQYIIDNLDIALKEEWIKAYHQPLIRAASGKVSDEEAFAKWEDPKYGTFSASEFVPILERKKLTYKLDLYMAERILKKIKSQGEHGLYMVPESINIAKTDFDRCDMVTEIAKRIDASGLSRDKLSVELSERTISSDVDFMKTQIERFHNEGIKVWMDDYGSGYSSLLLLLQIRFDLLKVDKAFVDQIEHSEKGRIILTELVKTALSLGMDTVAEGVETRAQSEFLREIGCTKLQGYFYTPALSLADIIERNEKGIQIGFENPAEVDYFEQLGKVNLYDLSISTNDDYSQDTYFDTMPMVIFSIDDVCAKFIRGNKTFREFIENNYKHLLEIDRFMFENFKPGSGYYSFNAVRQCAADGKRVIIDDRLKDGRSIQLLIRRIAVNPVTHSAAVAICILSVSNYNSEENLTYNYVARILSQDYIRLYFVDMDTENYTAYFSDGPNRDIKIDRRGSNFFNFTNDDFDLNMLPEDKEQLIKSFTKENVAHGIKNNEIFSVVTRVIFDEKPIFVSIKAVKVHGNGNNIIVGISDADAQIKDREALEKAREERLIYSRIGALNGDFVYIYTIDPKTMHFIKYNPSDNNSDMNLPAEGDDFFNTVYKRIPVGIYHEDVAAYQAAFTKENVFRQIKNTGIFEHHHRLNFNGKPVYVVMKATIVHEDDSDLLIIGIINVDERVKKELEYAKSLDAAENKAVIDDLTGIKNKTAYSEAERKINEQIANKEMSPFAIAVFDINDLKQVNDTLGHQAGDTLIQNGCAMICQHFKHSPVFRVGGDEFVAILKGYDYNNVVRLMDNFYKHNLENKAKGEVVVAAGMSKYDNDKAVATIFKRADEQMYANKKKLKKSE